MAGFPGEEQHRCEGALVGSLEPAELRRALRAATECLAGEMTLSDPQLAARIEPALRELAGS